MHSWQSRFRDSSLNTASAKVEYDYAMIQSNIYYNVNLVSLAKNLPGEGGQRNKEAAPDG
jgi:hypothetical protein